MGVTLRSLLSWAGRVRVKAAPQPASGRVARHSLRGLMAPFPDGVRHRPGRQRTCYTEDADARAARPGRHRSKAGQSLIHAQTADLRTSCMTSLFSIQAVGHALPQTDAGVGFRGRGTHAIYLARRLTGRNWGLTGRLAVLFGIPTASRGCAPAARRARPAPAPSSLGAVWRPPGCRHHLSNFQSWRPRPLCWAGTQGRQPHSILAALGSWHLLAVAGGREWRPGKSSKGVLVYRGV